MSGKGSRPRPQTREQKERFDRNFDQVRWGRRVSDGGKNAGHKRKRGEGV